MNLSELKAIDSRLKRVAAGESIRDVYGMIAAEPGLDGVRMAKALYEPTPIDEAWLEELGFRSDGPQYSSMSLGPVSWHHRFKRLVLFGEPIPQVTTRGQLLFLLFGLGVFDDD